MDPRTNVIPRPQMDPRVAALPRNAAAKPKGSIPLLCPFGCGRKEVNESGYCKHLIGFTDDNHNMELRQPQITKNGDDTGYEKVGTRRAKVLPTDWIVEMNSPTSRVYRDVDNKGLEPNLKPRAEEAAGDSKTQDLLREILGEIRDISARVTRLEQADAPPNQEEVDEDDDDVR